MCKQIISDSFKNKTGSLYIFSTNFEFRDHMNQYDWALNILGLICHKRKVDFYGV